MAVTRTSTVELIDLTDKINKIPRTPSVFDQLLDVSDESVTTTTVQVDVVQRNLDLMVAQRRGGERTNIKNASYITKSFVAPFFTLDGAIKPTDLQNLRQAGTANDVETVDNVRLNIMEDTRRYHKALRQKAVAEAIKGLSYVGNDLYPVYNYYTEFGVSKTTVPFDFTSATMDPMKQAEIARRAIVDNAQDGASGYQIVCLCGYKFFDGLLANPTFREAYQSYLNGAQPLRDRMGGNSNIRQMEHGSIVYIDVSSEKLGGAALLGDNDGYFIPVGIPDMFRAFYAPGDLIDEVNKPGKEIYMIEKRDYRSVKMETETSMIVVNTRPELVVYAQATYA